MSNDPGFLGFGYFRSPATKRLYVLSNGFVIGEVPAAAEPDLAAQFVPGRLHVAAEVDYVQRKRVTLAHYRGDLVQIQVVDGGNQLPLRSAADFRVQGLTHWDYRRMPPPLWPRLVQLGNTGCYTVVQSALRFVVRPAENELAILKTVPYPTLVADDGLAAFAAKETAQVDADLAVARSLLERLTAHPDNDDVNRSYG